MALHGSKIRRDMKWVLGTRVLISFILLSSYVTSSHQYTNQKTTPSSSNETKGVDNANGHAKVFYKHTWPVRVFNSQKLPLAIISKYFFYFFFRFIE
jgi:NADH:ubiquinone oxidoreductase subunit 6 (subunit J)